MTTTTAKPTQPEINEALGATDAKSARMRLVFLGYVRECGRCGGSGSHSYNPTDGTTCFGCRGSGKVLATITRKILATVAARVAAGELNPYFARNAARKAAKARIAPLYKLANPESNPICEAYSRAYAAKRFVEVNGLSGSKLMVLISAIHRLTGEAFSRVELDAISGKQEAPETLCPRLDAIAGEIAALNTLLTPEIEALDVRATPDELAWDKAAERAFHAWQNNH